MKKCLRRLDKSVRRNLRYSTKDYTEGMMQERSNSDQNQQTIVKFCGNIPSSKIYSDMYEIKREIERHISASVQIYVPNMKRLTTYTLRKKGSLAVPQVEPLN